MRRLGAIAIIASLLYASIAHSASRIFFDLSFCYTKHELAELISSDIGFAMRDEADTYVYGTCNILDYEATLFASIPNEEDLASMVMISFPVDAVDSRVVFTCLFDELSGTWGQPGMKMTTDEDFALLDIAGLPDILAGKSTNRYLCIWENEHTTATMMVSGFESRSSFFQSTRKVQFDLVFNDPGDIYVW